MKQDSLETPVECRLLGAVEVTVDGAALVVDTRKALGLLALLAIEGEVTRDRAAALLWSESSEERAKAALRRTLSTLRQGLSGRAVMADRHAIRMAGDEIFVDARALMSRTLGADAVVNMRRGAFLDGLVLRGADQFDAWVRDTARSLDREWLKVVDVELASAASTGDDERRARLAQARLSVEPAHERTHALLIWLAARAGDRDLVASRYRDCVGALHGALGTAPMQRTTRLHEQALAALAAGGTWSEHFAVGGGTADEEGTAAVERASAVLALSADPLPTTVVAGAAGLSLIELSTAVEALASDGSLMVNDDRLALSAAVRRQHAGRLGPIRSQSVHRRLAQELAGRPGWASARATHLSAAGDPAAAAVAWTVAADEAVHARAWEQARHHLDQALANGHVDQVGLLVRRAEIDDRRGRLDEARDGLLQAGAASTTPEERAHVDLRLGSLQMRRQQWAAALVHLNAARAAGAAVEAEQALVAWHLGKRAAAIDDARWALDDATKHGDLDRVLVATNILGLLLRRAGRFDDALDHVERGLALAGSDHPLRAALLNSAGLVQLDTGNVKPARELFEEARRVAADAGDIHREATVLNNLADTARAAGDLARARALVKESATRLALISAGPLPTPEIWTANDW